METNPELSHEDASIKRQRGESGLGDDKEYHSKRTDKRPKTEDRSTEPLGTDVLILDIGGEKTVKTLRSTLTFAAGSKLAETFSGRWDKSLPKSTDGSFFIDEEPTSFLPLLRFLRSLSKMTPADIKNPLPPLTPSFTDPNDEASFRRMVDSYDLTNVLYNYELYTHPTSLLMWNQKCLFSRTSSIFESPLSATPLDYTIDRATQKQGPCHNRQVQAFDVNVDPRRDCAIGWTCRNQVASDDAVIFYKSSGRMFFDAEQWTLRYYDREAVLHNSGPLGDAPRGHSEIVIRCCKNRETSEFEWFIGGTLVAATTRELPCNSDGQLKTDEGVFLYGWQAPEGCEMIPFVHVFSGSCRVSCLELEP